MRILALAAAVAMAGSGSAWGQAFNLECSGDYSMKSLSLNENKLYAKTFRIDLDDKLWCEDECRVVHQITDVQPTRITLMSDQNDAPTGRFTTSNTIDRVSGRHSMLYISSDLRGSARSLMTLTWDGVCQKSEFTGFPRAKF